MPRYVILDKKVGETPLECAENYRATRADLAGVPMAYAGRLDPMASGKLLVLIGEECKQQTAYHNLDKAYDFSVLLDSHSDTGDILGVVEQEKSPTLHEPVWEKITASLIGEITLPYPHYSSRTVGGKPLHTWAVEGKIHEINIPTKTSTIYKLNCVATRSINRQALYKEVIEKIALLPTVTDPRKALGNDFRRPLVHSAWKTFLEAGAPSDLFTLVDFSCTVSSGTYMRSLADVIAKKVETRGLAFSIHRTEIGRYLSLYRGFGWWKKRYR